MGDTTNFQMYVYSTTPDEARHFARFIGEHCLGRDWSTNFNADEPDAIVLGRGGGYTDNDASCGIVNDYAVGLAANTPNSVFVAWEDPKYEWLGVLIMHVPGLGVYVAECDADGNPVMSAQSILEMLDTVGDNGTVADVRVLLNHNLGKPWFDAIAALPEQPNKVRVAPDPDDE